MGLMEAVSSVFSKYADFSGRARRSEYWYFCLFNVLIYMAFSSLFLLSFRMIWFMTALYSVYSLAIIVPGLAVGCRRLHDIGRPGSYLLFAFIPVVGYIFLLIWFLQDSDPGSNRYGPNPKSSGAHYAAGGGYNHPAAYSNDGHRSRTMPVSSYTESTGSYDPPARAHEHSSLVLEGMAGYHLGRKFPIRGTMVAGRDPGCAISYPEDTHGVSHRHCQFRANGSSVVVTDLGSSYGTFINGKNKLKPNHPVSLSAGDTVSLGSQKQCFTVVQK